MSQIPELGPLQAILTVGELNRTVKDLIEHGLPPLWVSGEISNFTRASSGHWYLSLKDDEAQVRCVMFRHRNQYLDWVPRDGMQVEVRCYATLYEPRGEFQLNIETMRQSGLGALYEAFARLKSRLEREGLFREEHKRPLPRFPRRIGIITSPAAAALRDVLSTLRRRMPSIPVVIYPTPVQGEGAGQSIAAAILSAGERSECDVLIVCRGGGSIEDLWAFNEESVARAIAGCPIPVVTGIGHETDFTIADFAADRRAPTPTGAAELASPDRRELSQRLAVLYARLERITAQGIEQRMQRVDYLGRRLVHPGERLRARQEQLRHLGMRLEGAWARTSESGQWRVKEMKQKLIRCKPEIPVLLRRNSELAQRLQGAAGRRLADLARHLERLEAHLAHLNPQNVLERGYAIAQDANGAVVRDSAQIKVGEMLSLTLARGEARVKVTDKR